MVRIEASSSRAYPARLMPPEELGQLLTEEEMRTGIDHTKKLMYEARASGELIHAAYLSRILFRSEHELSHLLYGPYCPELD